MYGCNDDREFFWGATMDADELRQRTKDFGLRVIRLVRALPKSIETRAVGSQLVRSGTSVGANYRASRRARSRREHIAKLGIVVEEIDESANWLEVIMESNMMPTDKVKPLHEEAESLTRIFARSHKTLRDGGNR